MRISDWSSDVCSSDLTTPFEEVRDRLRNDIAREGAIDRLFEVGNEIEDALAGGATVEDVSKQFELPLVDLSPLSRQGQDQNGHRPAEFPTLRSEERRVGKERVSTCSTRGSPYQ